MSTRELKESIIEQLKSVENFSVLDRVSMILQNESSTILNLNSKQKQSILKGKSDFSDGCIKKNDAVFNKIDKLFC